MQLLEVTAASGLVIRRFPSADSERIVAMPLGMRVERLDNQVWNESWYRIRAHFSGDYVAEGYSASAHLRAVTPPQPAPAPRPRAQVVSVLHSLTPPTTARRHFDELHERLAGRVSQLLEACKEKGLKFKLFEAYRTPERQSHLFEQGRTRPGNIVSNAGVWRSMHNYGLAADLILDIPGINPWETRTVDGVDYMTFWKRMRVLAGKAGLKTLSWDLPHVEMPDTSWQALAKGELPAGGGAHWAANLERMIDLFADARVIDEAALRAALTMQRNAVSGAAAMLPGAPGAHDEDEGELAEPAVA